MVKEKFIQNGEFEKITELAKEAVELVKTIRNKNV